MEASGGIVLLITAAIALAWANSPWSHSYHDLWHTPIRLSIGSWTGSFNLHFVINDVLMTIFFLVAGLEIRRELVEGELSDMKRAALPVAAAIGGMLAPALIFYFLNPKAPAASGWGIPMATDIAFAVGVLSLLGSRVPAAMRILLLALAIIDDLGAILVIAIFYTSGVSVEGLAVAGVGIAILVFWLRMGIRPGPMYTVPLGVIWIGLFIAGVHPTLAGVIVGLTIPVKPWLSEEQFNVVAKRAIEDFHDSTLKNADHHELLEPIKRLSFAGREALSPVTRLVSELHVWVAFFIMPTFALANAGVDLGGIDFGTPVATPLILGVALGLAVGKPVGVMLMSWICVRLGLATLPRGVSWFGVLMVGLTAGIGFTMAIFIAELAFDSSTEIGMTMLSLAKLAILIGTGIAALVGLAIGVVKLRPVSPELAGVTGTDAERSTEY
jgi:NhaA family Na+:H+ antiporter